MKNFGSLVIVIFVFALDSTCQDRLITVQLEIEGKQQIIDGDFEIYFIIDDSFGKTIVKPKIDGNEFVMPFFSDSTKGAIIFKSKRYTIGMGGETLSVNQDMIWTFGTDNRPFGSTEYEGSSVDISKIKMINYLKYSPQEYGLGTVSKSFIRDRKEYNEGINRLLN